MKIFREVKSLTKNEIYEIDGFKGDMEMLFETLNDVNFFILNKLKEDLLKKNNLIKFYYL